MADALVLLPSVRTTARMDLVIAGWFGLVQRRAVNEQTSH